MNTYEKTDEVDKNGNKFVKTVFSELSDSLYVELTAMHTSKPSEPQKIYVNDKCWYDSTEYFYGSSDE